MRSPHTINEIMAAVKPVPDPQGKLGAFQWKVPGSVRGREGIWELVLDPEDRIIYHFHFK